MATSHRRKTKYASFHLGADVGGTNTLIGVFGKSGNEFDILSQASFKSRALGSLNEAAIKIKPLLVSIKLDSACFGVAGPVYNSGRTADLAKLGWKIDAQKLSKIIKTKTFLVNDFEAVAYGINVLSKNDISIIKKGEVFKNSPKIIVGAGTGLGKSSILFDRHSGFYHPVGGEAGHMDFAAQSPEEFEMAEFTARGNKLKNNLTYEDFLSGKGISRIYRFYLNKYKKSSSAHHAEIVKSNFDPSIISLFRKKDKICMKTFDKFSQIYARFAKCCALDVMAIGGVYIAGGIAPKNPDIFGKTFLKEFVNSQRHSKTLKKIPIYLVKNYTLGMKGAAFAAWLNYRK